MAVLERDIDLGRGLYGAREIERYAALHVGRSSLPRSQSWLRGVVAPTGHEPGRPDYSFGDLVSVFAVADLRLAGVSLQRIRQARGRLEDLVGVNQPFALRGLFTDNESVFADLGVDGQLTNLNLGGQEGHRPVLELKLDRVEFRAGETLSQRAARAWSPLDGVCLDPDIQFGTPCIAGRRVPTQAILRLIEEGATTDDLAHEFRLDSHEVEAALRFERRLAAVDS